jgi:dolichol-phosphate mannosyltransferase
MKLEIYIPVYNEGDGIQNVYSHIKGALADKLTWDICFIYDFPEDTTVPYINEIAKSDKRVRSKMQTYGKGVINALRYAVDISHEGPVLICMGDDSDEISVVPKMYQECVNGASLIAASRFSKGGRYIGGEFLKRNMAKVAGRILYYGGIGTKDPTNNFKMYSGKFLKSVEIESSGGFEIGLELVVKAKLNGLKVSEVPTTWRDRESGQSNFKLWDWLPYYLKWFFIFLLRFTPMVKSKRISI